MTYKQVLSILVPQASAGTWMEN